MSQVEYASVRMGLRAPRVAIVVEGNGQWDYWARLGLHQATHLWGGHGFIVIPHCGSEVHPALLKAAAAYDPDYVVAMHASIAQLETLSPGQFRPPELGSLGVDESAALLEEWRATEVPSRTAEAARDKAADACSVYRRREGGIDGWFEDLTFLSQSDTPRELPRITDIPGAPSGPVVHAPAGWAGELGVATAAKSGVMDEPSPGAPPSLEPAVELGHIRWLLGLRFGRGPAFDAVWHPTVTTSVAPISLPTALARTEHGLVSVHTGFGRRTPMLVVLGEAAADFALGLAWDRLYGHGLWLPPSWYSGSHEAKIRGDLSLEIERLRARGTNVLVTSTSLPKEELIEFVGSLGGLGAFSPRGSRASGGATVAATDAGELPFPKDGTRHLAIADQFDQQFALPARVDSAGGVELVAAPPPPVIRAPELAGVDELLWQVDLQIQPDLIPKGRGIDGQRLLASGENPYLTWVRSGRDGVSFESGRYDFVLAGTAPESRLARPRLRQPGMLEWVQIMAEQNGASASLSAVGRRAVILERLWGSRIDLVRGVAGPLRDVLRRFRAADTSTRGTYPLGDGVVLQGEGYLTFQGMAACAPADIDLRKHLDDLLRIGALMRGLVLDCSECGRPAFVRLDMLKQVNACARCGRENDLAQPRWRNPADEPRWFYDLHPAIRELLAQNGDVPLLLSEHLRNRARRFLDVSEVEFAGDGLNGLRAEADLIAVADDRLIIAETKIGTRLGDGESSARAARKRAEIASLLCADEVLIATTAPEWNPSATTEVQRAVNNSPHRTGTAPVIRVITGLVTPTVEDRTLPVQGAN